LAVARFYIIIFREDKLPGSSLRLAFKSCVVSSSTLDSKSFIYF